MLNKQPGYIAASLFLLDIFFLNAVWYGHYYFGSLPLEYVNYQPIILINLCFSISVYFLKAYKLRNIFRKSYMLSKLLKSSFICFGLMTLMLIFRGQKIHHDFVMSFFIWLTILLLLLRFVSILLLQKLRTAGYYYSKILIAGIGEDAQRLRKFVKSSEGFGCRFLGFIVNEVSHKAKDDIFGGLQEMQKMVLARDVDEIYWTLPQANKDEFRHLINLCEANLVRVHMLPEEITPLRNFETTTYGGLPVVRFRQEPLEMVSNRIFKRVFDIAISSVVILLVLSWLLPLVSLLIKLTSKGPVFFRQERTGEGNESFSILKFRTMKVNNASDTSGAVKDDPRITPIGHLLRLSHIDEFPQFLQTLTGKMSIVGPRPHMLLHTDEYSKQIDKFMVRHLVKPGITGWAQVQGYRGQIKDLDDMIKRVEADVWYIENWSFYLDMKVCVETFFLMGSEFWRHLFRNK